MTDPTRIQVRQAAGLLGVSMMSVRRLIASGQLRAAKVGGIWTIATSDVATYLERNIAVSQQWQKPAATTFMSAMEFGGPAFRSTDATPGARYERVTKSRPSSASKRC
ncbi:MAG: Helix-turn-helix domain [Rhodospirillales bacterium]|jgi:excisionase family DNA binding protein|nr:Helix-turn-helix domain [Rhodospirillales bacterium]